MENKEVIKILHDLNNILCACSGFSEILFDIEDREYQKHLLDVIKNNLLRMAVRLDNVRIDLLNDMSNEKDLIP